MSYESKSIYEAISEIDAGKFYLPALQRKFVWNEERITLLFDSILRGYPISTFLFWFLRKEKANEYVFYKFLDRFDERDPFNKRKDGTFTQDEIIGVLDGQQRLSSIYIGLQGKYITKEKYKHKDNPYAYPERQLYLNLLNTPFQLDESGDYAQVLIQESENFEFRFLNPASTQSRVYGSKEKRAELWFKVGDIIKWNADTSANDVYEALLEDEKHQAVESELNQQRRMVIKTLENLRDKFIKEKLISYFKTNKEDLEAILNIFVRVNSGAVALSKSDLLFSTIIATWENGRDEIESLQKNLNKKGDGFHFNNDFVMRSLLVLSDLPVVFKVNSFKSENVKRIKDNWSSIKDALLKAVDILAEGGLSGWLVPSQNAVIPIAYYIMKGGVLNPTTKADLLKYLKHAFLKNIFGSQGDNVIAATRTALRSSQADKSSYTLRDPQFSFNAYLGAIKLPGDKSLYISKDDMEEFLSSKKSPYTFLLLSMIYPHFKYGQVKLHQDHIHPYSGFNHEKFDQLGLDDAQKGDWWEKRDMLPNLQLMEGRENQSKNDKPFAVWISQTYTQDAEGIRNKEAFLDRNFLNALPSLEFTEFEQCFSTRKERLKKQLEQVLAVKYSSDKEDNT